jgi:hypothetical protein
MNCNSSSVPLEQQCYGRGACVGSNASSACNCVQYFVFESYCRLTHAEYLNYVDVALYAVRAKKTSSLDHADATFQTCVTPLAPSIALGLPS